jgi:TIR domain
MENSLAQSAPFPKDLAMNQPALRLTDWSHIKPLCERERGFLQVLLKDFTLTKTGGGLAVEVNIAEDDLSIIDSDGKRDFNEAIARSATSARPQLQARLENFLDDRRQLGYCFDCSQMPLRYANGGVLPIIHYGADDYFCLFYRDIFPIGWNIANGASDDLDDLLDPGRIISREFGEELLIFDDNEKVIYCYDPGDENRPPGFQKRALKAWAARWKDRDLSSYRILPTPLKWIDGPDRVEAHVLNRRKSTDGYFLSITPDDNAIEVDRWALINLRGDASIVDGEFTSVLVNRIVGMFRVEGFEKRLDNEELRPDFHFFDGEKKDPSDLNDDLESNLASLGDFRSPRQLQEYREAETRLDLCPITRRVIKRYYQWAKDTRSLSPAASEPRIGTSVNSREPYDVFVSYRAENTTAAQWLYEFLTDRPDSYRVFCSAATLTQVGESDYAAAINRALDSAKCLVVFGMTAEHFRSGWVDYEWKSFLNEILSGRKKSAELFTFVGNISAADLPYALRSRQMVPYSAASPQDSFENLERYIRPVVRRSSPP